MKKINIVKETIDTRALTHMHPHSITLGVYVYDSKTFVYPTRYAAKLLRTIKRNTQIDAPTFANLYILNMGEPQLIINTIRDMRHRYIKRYDKFVKALHTLCLIQEVSLDVLRDGTSSVDVQAPQR